MRLRNTGNLDLSKLLRRHPGLYIDEQSSCMYVYRNCGEIVLWLYPGIPNESKSKMMDTMPSHPDIREEVNVMQTRCNK